MYLSDIHTHSIASGHGTICTISDMAKAASKKGIKTAWHYRSWSGHSCCRYCFLFQESDLCSQRRDFGIELLVWEWN